MHLINKQLVIFTGLLVFVPLNNASPLPETTIGELMTSINSSDKLGLVNYFKELKLDKNCNSGILDVKSFQTNEKNFKVPCLCTVIYNTTKILETYSLSESEVEAAKTATNNYKYGDASVYENWKNATSVSPSLKLLMDPLVNVTQWNLYCHNIDNNLIPFCKFLNVEILLLKNYIQTSNPSVQKPDIDNLPENVKDQEPINVPVEAKKTDDLPESNIVGGSNSSNNVDVVADDSQKNKEDAGEEELQENFESKDEAITEDDPVQNKSLDVKEKDAQVPTESKVISKSSNDYSADIDGTITQPETKDQWVFNPKNTFANREFGDPEDSHFLFYFGIMTLLSMVFYLVLYNKKKIIALLIEGRRSNSHRRRPNTATYSKVETDDGSSVF